MVGSAPVQDTGRWIPPCPPVGSATTKALRLNISAELQIHVKTFQVWDHPLPQRWTRRRGPDGFPLTDMAHSRNCCGGGHYSLRAVRPSEYPTGVGAGEAASDPRSDSGKRFCSRRCGWGRCGNRAPALSKTGRGPSAGSLAALRRWTSDHGVKPTPRKCGAAAGDRRS